MSAREEQAEDVVFIKDMCGLCVVHGAVGLDFVLCSPPGL